MSCTHPLAVLDLCMCSALWYDTDSVANYLQDLLIEIT